ncbi:hypothetical protein [Stetteria hydrogenophila]
MANLSAGDIVRLFEGDERARRRLAEILAPELDARLAIASAALRDVATKSDVERLEAKIERLRDELRGEFRRELKGEAEGLRRELRSEIEGLRGEFDARLRGAEGAMGEMWKTLDFIGKLTAILTGSLIAALLVVLLALASAAH